MTLVPEKVLAWLYSVLHEYRDPQRTYSDIARTLSAYPTLSPRTEVYTYENGSSALLLTLSGTLPVSFRGSTYRFPVKLWVPKTYPQEVPIVYVTPGKDMVVRPGQHVGVDGRVYHPYLREWPRIWHRASIAELLEFLQQVFAKEPPVISRAQQQQYQRSIGQYPQQYSTASPIPGPPQLPPKPRVGSGGPAEMSSTSTPPPRPPKPGDEYADTLPQRSLSRNVVGDGPPLPPLPHERDRPELPYATSPHYQNGHTPLARPQHYAPPPAIQFHPNGRSAGPPPLPHLPQQQPQLQQYHQQSRTNHDRSPVSPVSPVSGYSELPEAKYSRAPPLPGPQQASYQYQRQPQLPPVTQQSQHQVHYQTQPQPLPHQYQQSHVQSYPPQPPAQQRKAPPPDLLSDPFDVALPGSHASTQPAPAPPIPPNPEKEHLLHALSTALVQQAQAKVSQNLSAIAPLQAQQYALQSAYSRLDGEIHQLKSLSTALDTNEAILRRSIQDCENTTQAAKQKKQPPIDEVLIAPTMVANQLWTLCAEEAACREAMYVLQKAVDRGRVSGEVFVRQMRALGREAFVKMVLARKCARGLGLEVAGVR